MHWAETYTGFEADTETQSEAVVEVAVGTEAASVVDFEVAFDAVAGEWQLAAQGIL